MNKRIFAFGILVLALLFITISSAPVFATSWIKLSPQKVIDKSQIVVSGKYSIPDNQNQQWNNNNMWVPFTFTVDKYYKGSGNQSIKAAIERYDVGLAKEHQDKGGRFILFLHKNSEAFWTPVGGPNGMIQTVNGKIQNLSPDEVKQYENFLVKSESKLPAKAIQPENPKTIPILLISIPLLAVVLILVKKLRNR